MVRAFAFTSYNRFQLNDGVVIVWMPGDHQLMLPVTDAIAPGNYVLDISSPEGRVDVHVMKE